MQELMTNYLITDFDKNCIDQLVEEILAEKAFELSFPLQSIGFSQSSLDIVSDYSEVSYCCEKLVPFIIVLDSKLVTREKYYTDFKITCKCHDLKSFISYMTYLKEMLTQEFDVYGEIDRISFMDEILTYETCIESIEFTFPELINGYWANLINQGYLELASNQTQPENLFLSRIYKKNPEHRYGYWKNPISKSFNETIYFSIDNWVIPPHTDLTTTLSLYSGLENQVILEAADRINYQYSTILLNNFTAIYFRKMPELINGINFIENLLTSEESATIASQIIVQYDIFGGKKRKTHSTKKKPRIISVIDEKNLTFYLSQCGGVTSLEYKSYKLVFFQNEMLNFSELKGIYEYLNPTFSKIQNLIASAITSDCNFSILNDNSFEELCYDILYCHPNFDSSTIQKMGKSRSRDGGRDIVVKTRRTPTKEQELYIFQCKFLSENSSLSASKIGDAANVIIQYGAKGYGVFTTAVIDATLYDMLDGFNRSIGVNVSHCYSKYELTRLLNLNSAIKSKYFK